MTQPKYLVAYCAWRRAAEKGYGARCHHASDKAKVDNRIRRLKDRYEALAKAYRLVNHPIINKEIGQ